jgi:Rad3-related DNA helicase
MLIADISFRENQGEAIVEIAEKFRGGKRTIFLDAPVGSGKSLIHMVLPKVLGVCSYITTPQVLLVKQYARETEVGGKWEGLAKTVMGRSNYPCTIAMGKQRQMSLGDDVQTVLQALAPPIITAAEAECLVRRFWPAGRHKHHPAFPQQCITPAMIRTPPWIGASPCVEGCPHYADCPYYSAKRQAQASPTAVTTLDYFFTAPVYYISGWQPRPLLIVDEAHGLDSSLTRFFTMEVKPWLFPDLDVTGLDSMPDRLMYLRRVIPDYRIKQEEVMARLQAALDDRGSNEGEPPSSPGQDASLKRLTEQALKQDALLKRIQKLEQLLSITDVRWVYIFHEKNTNEGWHEWRPLSTEPFTRSIFSQYRHILLSSGTFINPARLGASLGLPEPWDMVTVPSTFPPSAAPIYLLGVTRFRHGTMEENLRISASIIEDIAGRHHNERGVIHCNSYRMAKFLEKQASPELRARLMFHEKEERIARFETWKGDQEEGGIFVGVAMSEGLDLPGDEARWQIIVKAPFASIADPWVIAKRAEPDGATWYEEQALVQVMQACGRIVRSKEDWGTTYVLDSQVTRLVKQYWSRLPRWFQERLSVAPGVIPGPLSRTGQTRAGSSGV